MANVKLDTRLPVAADALWRLIGGFNALPQWHPAVAKSEATGESAGAKRTLSLAGGGAIVEELEAADSAGRSYRYSILSGPLPVADYHSELKVVDNGDGSSTVEWSSRFEPKDASEQDAVKVIQGVYQAGLDNLRKLYGA